MQPWMLFKSVLRNKLYILRCLVLILNYMYYKLIDILVVIISGIILSKDEKVFTLDKFLIGYCLSSSTIIILLILVIRISGQR